MSLITGKQAVAVAVAIARAGGRWTPIYRQPKDANGVPNGAPVRIGCILGVRFARGQMSAITIDVPGVVVRPDTPRFEGVLANGCTPPMQGDTICVGGQHIPILDVMTQLPPLYILTLQP